MEPLTEFLRGVVSDPTQFSQAVPEITPTPAYPPVRCTPVSPPQYTQAETSANAWSTPSSHTISPSPTTLSDSQPDTHNSTPSATPYRPQSSPGALSLLPPHQFYFHCLIVKPLDPMMSLVLGSIFLKIFPTQNSSPECLLNSRRQDHLARHGLVLLQP